VQAHDGAAFVAAIDWTPVIVAVITLFGVCVNVLGAIYIAVQLRTPSGPSIGKQVEAAHLTSISNAHRITALARRLDAPEPLADTDEAA